MRIYLLRHVRTGYNSAHRISGTTDIPVLPNQKLILPDQPIHFDLILSSPAQRCRETLQLLSDEWDYSETKVQFMPELAERNLGVLEGMYRADAISKYPALFCNGKLRVDAVPARGESISDVIHRISPMIAQLRHMENELENILIVSHNQLLKIMSAVLLKTMITDEYWRKQNYLNGVLYYLDIAQF